MAKKTGTFPKTKFKAKVVECKAKENSCEIKLSKIELTGGQYERVKDIMDEGDLVFVTFQAEQGTLPGTQ